MTCGKKPLGYTACSRPPEHDGQCSHEVDLDAVAVDLRAVIPELTPEDLDAMYWGTIEAIYGKRGTA